MWALVFASYAFLSPRVPLAPARMPSTAHRSPPPRAADAPIDDLNGIEMLRKLSEISYAQQEVVDLDQEALLSGRSVSSLGAARVTVSLYYGKLTGGDAAGTRCLIKEYSSLQPEQPMEDSAATAADAEVESLLRQGLERSFSGAAASPPPPAPPPAPEDQLAAAYAAEQAAANAARERLEASLRGEGRSGQALAEAMAQNEYAAHRRLQTPGRRESKELTRLIGRLTPGRGRDEPALVLLAFPWPKGGEQVRMALPQRPPPTLASWAELRKAGKTDGAFWDKSVPNRAGSLRGKFVKASLCGALRGLVTLHDAGLLHQSLGLSSVELSTEDDRKGDGASGGLCDFAFARDTRTLAPASRSAELYGELVGGVRAADADDAMADVLDLGLESRAASAVAEGDEDGRRRFAVADEMRAFGVLLLTAMVVPNQPAGGDLDPFGLLRLLDGPYAAAGGSTADGAVNVDGLRDYLDAEADLRVGGVGGVDMLDAGGGAGWALLARLLGPWQERPTAEEALADPFWEAAMDL